MKNYKIGWQKYEDYLEKQLSSPMLDVISEMFMGQMENEYDDEEEVYQEANSEESSSSHKNAPVIPVSQKLLDDLSMLSSYDCWLGHTNFDITEDTKNILDHVDGVEMLTICSRYRFFIGIGQMFDFSEVRKRIEDSIIPQ
jgi:hypothetical protein